MKKFVFDVRVPVGIQYQVMRVTAENKQVAIHMGVNNLDYAEVDYFGMATEPVKNAFQKFPIRVKKISWIPR